MNSDMTKLEDQTHEMGKSVNVKRPSRREEARICWRAEHKDCSATNKSCILPMGHRPPCFYAVAPRNRFESLPMFQWVVTGGRYGAPILPPSPIVAVDNLITEIGWVFLLRKQRKELKRREEHYRVCRASRCRICDRWCLCRGCCFDAECETPIGRTHE